MGCPDIYYKRSLQYFAHAIAFDESVKLAKELREEKSSEKLEEYILSKKTTMAEKDFYYNAGRATQCVFDEAYDEGCDALNASCSGINAFEYFIGIEDDDE